MTAREGVSGTVPLELSDGTGSSSPPFGTFVRRGSCARLRHSHRPSATDTPGGNRRQRCGADSGRHEPVRSPGETTAPKTQNLRVPEGPIISAKNETSLPVRAPDSARPVAHDEPQFDPARLAADLAAATVEMEAMPEGLDKAETRMMLNLVHCFAGLAEMGTLGVESGMELLAILKQGRDPAAGR